MRTTLPVLVLTLVLAGCPTTVTGVKSTVDGSATVKLGGKLLDTAGVARTNGQVTIHQPGNPLANNLNPMKPANVGADGTWNATMPGAETKNALNQPYLFTAEASGDHGEWISQEFYITSNTATVPTLKLWDGVTAEVDAATGDFQCKWTPPAGGKFTEATLLINQDLQDVWEVTLPDPAKGGTFSLPGFVLDDTKLSNVKVKLRGSPTSYDSANHDFLTAGVAGAKVLKFVSAKYEYGIGDDGGLYDGIRGALNPVHAPSPIPSSELKPNLGPNDSSAVVLDLGESKTIAKLAFYGGDAKSAPLTIGVSDNPDGKGGKGWKGGKYSSVVDLGGAKGRYVRLAGEIAVIESLREVRAVAP